MLGPADIHQLEKLRRFRAPKERDLTLHDVLSAAQRDFQRKRRAVGAIAEAWAAVISPALAERTSLVSLSRGLLTVRASDASLKYELERTLRAGAEAELIRASPLALRRVKVIL